MLEGGEPIYVSPVVACELAWVLRSRYRQSRSDIHEVLGRLLQSDQVVVDRDLIQAGLGMLRAGGDFSDGVILQEARRVGARDLMTFDQNLARAGAPTVTLLS
ncbi:MAG: type II toxin-antitoxin system VapC family toxin [Brevundimonas sp.]